MVSVVASSPKPGSIDALLAVSLDDLTDDDLGEHLRALHHATAALDAARVHATDWFDARAVWSHDGARNAPGWVTARTGASYGTAKADQHLARDLRSMPVVADAFATGGLSRDQARALAKARVPELADAFAACEQILVAEMARLTVAAGVRFLRRWAAEVRERFGIGTPDGPEPGGSAGRSKVHLSGVLDGRWRLDGDLTGEDGEIIRNVLDAQIDAMWRDGVFTADDGLTTSERFATALVEVLVRGSQGGDDGTARPLLVGIIRLTPVRAPDHTEHAGVPCGLAGGRVPVGMFGLAELEHAGLAHPADVSRWLCEGTLHILGHHDDWDDLRMGRRVRIATRTQRRALRARDGGCVFPGCAVTGSHCVAHHVRWWEWGGDTDLDNLVLLCRFHHKAIHDRGFHLTRHDGVVEVTRPDGSPLTASHATRPDPTMTPIVPRREPDADEAHLHRHTRHRIDALIADALDARDQQ